MIMSFVLLQLITLPITIEHASILPALMVYIIGPFGVNCYPSHHCVMLMFKECLFWTHV
jgi:hypothetical protein